VATATLVNRDIEVGRQIVGALTRASIPVTVYLWAFLPEQEEWQFIVATPLVDSKGPLQAYKEVNRALQREGLLPAKWIFLKSPHDPVLKSLEKASRAVPEETYRVVNEQIGSTFVEDAYLYVGSIHVVRSENSKETVPGKYSVIYAPYSGPGGAVPSVKLNGLGALIEFLGEKLRVDPSAVEVALKELAIKGSTSIPNVQLRTQELRRLGLA
jgi:hypothetical protein